MDREPGAPSGRPSREQVAKHAVWLALARAGFGAPAVAAPGATLRLLGARRARQTSSARFFAGFFGVRELLLAVFLVAARHDPARLQPTVAFGALADLGDTALLLRDVLSRKRLEPQAALLLSSGLAGSAVSVALWREVRAATVPAG